MARGDNGRKVAQNRYIRPNPAHEAIHGIIRLMDVKTQADLLDQFIDGLARCLTAESARRVVEVRASPEVQARVDALAEKANEGQLTPDERAQYEGYVALADFISILQAKARRILATQNAA